MPPIFTLKKFLASEPDQLRPFVGIPKEAFQAKMENRTPKLSLVTLPEYGGWHLVDAAVRGKVQLPNLWNGILVECVLASGKPFLLPITDPIGPDYEGWARTLKKAVKQADTQWTRIVSDKANRRFDIYPVDDLEQEPDWWNGDFESLIAEAFKGKIIDEKHPLARRKRAVQTDFDEFED